jgi:hypothetical protein
MSNELIVLGEFNGIAIHARASDKYVDVTELCQTHGKEWYDYTQTPSAKRFRDALSANTRKSGFGSAEDDGLVIKTRSETGQRGHTFADRRIALHCASWISAEFEIWVYDRIDELSRLGYTSIGKSNTEALSSQTLRLLAQQSTYLVDAFEASGERINQLSSKMDARIDNLLDVLVDVEQSLRDKLEEMQTLPKALRSFNGPRPDVLNYSELRRAMLDMSLWFMSEFKHLPPNYFWDAVYHEFAARTGFNVKTHRTAHVNELNAITGRELAPSQLSHVSICESYGVLRDVYRLAWELTQDGTACAPYRPYVAVSEDQYPVTLEPRGERAGLPLFPAWVYAPARPVGKQRKNKNRRQTVEGARNEETARAKLNEKPAQKAYKLPEEDNLVSGLTMDAVTRDAAVKQELNDLQNAPVADKKASEPFFAAQQKS